VTAAIDLLGNIRQTASGGEFCIGWFLACHLHDELSMDWKNWLSPADRRDDWYAVKVERHHCGKRRVVKCAANLRSSQWFAVNLVLNNRRCVLRASACFIKLFAQAIYGLMLITNILLFLTQSTLCAVRQF